jgi:hypothetical protein
MKAEPESRIENGVDVKFSIDDLAAKAEPEPWDGENSSKSFIHWQHRVTKKQAFALMRPVTTSGR